MPVSGILLLGSFLILPCPPFVTTRSWSYKLCCLGLQVSWFLSQLSKWGDWQETGGFRWLCWQPWGVLCSSSSHWMAASWLLALHSNTSTSILCLPNLKLLFLPTLLISGLSSPSSVWLLAPLPAPNQFPAVKSFCTKYFSAFCFSASIGPTWPRPMGTSETLLHIHLGSMESPVMIFANSHSQQTVLPKFPGQLYFVPIEQMGGIGRRSERPGQVDRSCYPRHPKWVTNSSA